MEAPQLPSIAAKFPTVVWDGTSYDRPRPEAHAELGPFATRQIVEEVKAIERYLLGAGADPSSFAVANTLGTVIGKLAVKNAVGAVIGYIPVYDTITDE